MQVVIDIDKCEYNKIKRANSDYLIPYEKIIKNGTPLPENATNGDVIKAMFPIPKGSVYTDRQNAVLFEMETLKKWWNAPYKADKEE